MSLSKISTLLKTEFILLDLKSTSFTEAIHEVTFLLNGHDKISNLELFYQDILGREQSQTSYLGNGVAFPHARTNHVKSMVLAVGRSIQGIKMESQSQNAHFIFVIGTPKKMVMDYLTVAGSLARLLHDTGIREQLMQSTTTKDFYHILASSEQKL
jgi:mannitol/fructose-specific phosphotransferase system IIA component (Ntr-type)